MARGFFINGEALVTVKLANVNPGLWELGLTDGSVFVSPRLIHKDLHTDDYGGEIPPEVLWMLGDCTITMTLIHFDSLVLRWALMESMAGCALDGAGNPIEGTYAGAGTPMGGWNPPGHKGNHYISLGILSQQAGLPWRFPTAYLPQNPLQWPMGTEKSIASLTWRAIAYAQPPAINGSSTSQPRFGEIASAGQVLYDHKVDTGTVLNMGGDTGGAQPPAFVANTGVWGSNFTATAGQYKPFAFRVSATGVPPPTLTVTGTLPGGISFTDLGNGAGVFVGKTVFAGNYSIQLTAKNNNGSAAQTFTLIVV